MTSAQIILLVIGGVYVIIRRTARQHLDRFGQFLQFCLLLAFLAVFWGWMGTVISLAAMLVLIYFVQGKVRYPCPLVIRKVSPGLPMVGYERTHEFSEFVNQQELIPVADLEEAIPPLAVIRSWAFSRGGDVFLRLQKIEMYGKSKWKVIFESYFADGGSITTTNSFTNSDVSWPERHPIYRVRRDSLAGLLDYHNQKVRANPSPCLPLDADRYVTMVQQAATEKFATAIKTGSWTESKGSYVMTPKGRVLAIARYFNFSTMLQQERKG